ncbi:molybdenum cofactor guanylyltransferase MobA [Methylotetracoccus oryzae]|uniref:molybdenum cofactor guanylyltransferase MobA n=1 Tax=Methylotetracoccus oryzae TaxID=1919059 RepID=UPI001F3525F8|nr:molybdenum cofactor guanylyltransferase MobA [Methylotetracoccus oryzae]
MANPSTLSPDRSQITGIVLAGGRARRLGGTDKGLIDCRGRPLVAYAVALLQAVAGSVVINANRNAERYATFGYPVIPDATDNFDGPLAGLLAGLAYARTGYVLTLPVDAPLMTEAVLRRLPDALAAQDADVCVPDDGVRLQPVFMLVRRNLKSSLEAYLADGGRKVDAWLAGQRLAIADCSDVPAVFANVNAPEDLVRVERLMREGGPFPPA